MSRRDRKGRPERRTRVDAPRPRKRGIGRWIIATVVLLVAIGGTWLGLRPRGRGRAEEAHAIADPAAAVSPYVAYQRALELSRAGGFEASLPFFERALQGTPPEPWLIHYNYAGALYSVGLEERGPAGHSRPALRSSIERVALMRRALAELDVAERQAPTAHDRATVIHDRSVRLRIWGFPWDSFAEMRRAQWTEPGQKSHGAAADGYMLVLEHPERGREGPPAREPLSPRASPP